MNKKYCIIGTGKQGTAAAYDLLKFANIDSLLLIDTNQESIDRCLLKIKFVISKHSGKSLLIKRFINKHVY